MVEKDNAEKGYRAVHNGEERMFLWGDFDCGTVTWQRALADAKLYARTGKLPPFRHNYFA